MSAQVAGCEDGELLLPLSQLLGMSDQTDAPEGLSEQTDGPEVRICEADGLPFVLCKDAQEAWEVNKAKLISLAKDLEGTIGSPSDLHPEELVARYPFNDLKYKELRTGRCVQKQLKDRKEDPKELKFGFDQLPHLPPREMHELPFRTFLAPGMIMELTSDLDENTNLVHGTRGVIVNQVRTKQDADGLRSLPKEVYVRFPGWQIPDVPEDEKVELVTPIDRVLVQLPLRPAFGLTLEDLELTCGAGSLAVRRISEEPEILLHRAYYEPLEFPLLESKEGMRHYYNERCCFNCRLTNTTARCIQCGLANYCSVECAKEDGKKGFHKQICSVAQKIKMSAQPEDCLRYMKEIVPTLSLPERMLAFCMGLHDRLGSESRLASLHKLPSSVLIDILRHSVDLEGHRLYRAIRIPGDIKVHYTSDVREAREMYNNAANCLIGLPDFDPTAKTANCRTFGWAQQENQFLSGVKHRGYGNTIWFDVYFDGFLGPGPPSAKARKSPNSMGFLLSLNMRGDIILTKEVARGDCSKQRGVHRGISKSEVLRIVFERAWYRQGQNSATERLQAEFVWENQMKLVRKAAGVGPGH